MGDVIMQFLVIFELFCNGSINLWNLVFNGNGKEMKCERIKFVVFVSNVVIEKEIISIDGGFVFIFFWFQFYVYFVFLV